MSTYTDEQQAKIMDGLIDAAIAGDAPWQQPWVSLQGSLPYNVKTGKQYTGVNLLWLWFAQQVRGTFDGRWMTKKQAADAGYEVRAGARSESIIYISTFVPKQERIDAEAEGREPTSSSFARIANVFHAADIDGLPEAEQPALEPVVSQHDVPEALQQLIAASKVHTSHQAQDKAFHIVDSNLVVLPLLAQFEHVAGFVSTVLHELSHWTGGKARLGRDQSGSFGTPQYAAEELVAEMSAALTAARLGLPHEPANSHAYLRSWAGRIDRVKMRRAMQTAASQAQKASNLLVDIVERDAPAIAA